VNFAEINLKGKEGDFIEALLLFIDRTFNINVLVLFLLASIFLIFIDAPNYKKTNYVRESRFCKAAGYIYIILGFGLFIAARLIRV
jgi:hypothetical protein